jgi:hypothetical protein
LVAFHPYLTQKEARTNLCGHGHFDMAAYDAYLAGQLQDYEYPAEAQKRMPAVV